MASSQKTPPANWLEELFVWLVAMVTSLLSIFNIVVVVLLTIFILIVAFLMRIFPSA